MDNLFAIYIFTKDRPDILAKTLESVVGTPYQIFIVDDSALSPNNELVTQLCHRYAIGYLGKEAFQTLSKKICAKGILPSKLLRSPGHAEWNLGYMRNFALVHAVTNRFEKIIYMDDDISVTEHRLLKELFSLIDAYLFAGAEISGMIDDSIMGHIATDLDIFNDRMLSGGFLAFNPKSVNHFFLNIYNEDWLWLFLQLSGRNYIQFGKVLQNLTDAFENYEKKIEFQEYGELALEGVINCYRSASFERLQDLDFWKSIVVERLAYLNQLHTIAGAQQKKHFQKIISLAKNVVLKLEAEEFFNLFVEYNNELSLFKKILDTFH